MSLGMFTDAANALMLRALNVVLTEVTLDPESLNERFTFEVDLDEWTAVEGLGSVRYFDDDKILDAVVATAKKLRTIERLDVDLDEAYDTVVREAVAREFVRATRGRLRPP